MLWRKKEVSLEGKISQLRDNGYFVSEEKEDYIYVPRKRVSDNASSPPALDMFLDDFQRTADRLIGENVTMMRYERLFTLWQCIINTAWLRLPFVEIGVWRGGSSYLMATAYRLATGEEPRLYCLDTFEGHPGHVMDPELDSRQRVGGFASTKIKRVQKLMADFPGARVVAGEATETVKTLEDAAFGFAHIDTDLYRPTRTLIETFNARMPVGAMMIIDDFGSPSCEGVKAAVNEIRPELPDWSMLQMQTEQCLLVRTRAPA